MSENGWIIVLIILLLAAPLLAMVAKQSTTEGYRIKARAYSSCTEGTCDERVARIQKTNLLIMNPFVWPYSGTPAPERLELAFAPDIPILNPESTISLTTGTAASVSDGNSTSA